MVADNQFFTLPPVTDPHTPPADTSTPDQCELVYIHSESMLVARVPELRMRKTEN